MSIDRDEPYIAQCWAFNVDGQRCEQIAGHDGKHAVTRSWSDAECFSPIVHQLPNVGQAQSPARVAAPTSGVCLICDHPMHNGECGAQDGEFTCDCSNGVEG